MKKPDPLAQALAFFDQAPPANDLVPEGFFTAKQIAQARGADRQTTKLKLDRMVACDMAECRVFKVGTHRSAHYRIFAK